jgi:outer membrane protein OmpA-like peptidoglycan-associated protein
MSPIMNFKRLAVHILLPLLILFFLSSCATSQKRGGKSTYSRNNRSYYKQRYASSTKPASSQCFQLFKNKKRSKNRRVIASKNKGWESQPMAEYDPNDKPTTKPTPKPAPKPVAQVKPDIDKMDLETKHIVEDDVLKKNKLPAPTSAKHEQIRKNVESHLENFDKEKPIKLEPLYFVTGQDEFAFVDMDPFLVAVEYALQGKIILIEGHTDHVGDYKANVALSIKRVEKIRELMIQMGVHDEKISVVGYGEEQSEASKTSESKQNERRVDFTVF